MPFLLFDLDGTISDPIEGIGRSINYTLNFHGYEKQPINALSKYIGPPLDETFRTITGATSESEIANIVATYRKQYGAIGYSENILYPGIESTIKDLASQHVSMGICTSKREDFADKILHMFGIREYFEFISGGEIGIKKEQQIESLFAKNLIDQNTIMIGDRAIDLVAAHKNGLRSAAVLWGYGSREELKSELPHFLLECPQDLKSLLDIT